MEIVIFFVFQLGETGRRGLCNQFEEFPDKDYERDEERAEKDCLMCHRNRRENHKDGADKDPGWCHGNTFSCGILNTTFKNAQQCNEFYRAKGFGSEFCKSFAKFYDSLCIDMPWLDVCC